MTTSHRLDWLDRLGPEAAVAARTPLQRGGKPVPPPLEVTVDRRPGSLTVVEVVGDVDLQTAAGLLDVLQRELDRGVRVLVLDLDGVGFLAACGITTLLDADRAAQRSGADLRLVGGCRLVRRPLELLGITAEMPLHRDVVSALAEPVRIRRRRPQPTDRLTAALIRYLEAVAVALNRRAVAVAGVEITGSPEVACSGRIQLGRQRPGVGGPEQAVELRWSESTGWEVALWPGAGEAAPWRFLHVSLAPEPVHVAAFTYRLLRGEELGLPYPAQFRSSGGDTAALYDVLGRAIAPVRRA